MSDKINFILRFILFAMFHSLFAANWTKKLLSCTDSRVYRICYNFASLFMVEWVMSAYRNSEMLYYAEGGWKLFMYLLQLVVVLILVICLRETGISELVGYAKLTPGSFTNSGWHSIVRHPLYFFSTLFMILNPVMTSQWLLLTIMSTLYFLTGGFIEERRLANTFGEAYKQYQQQVPFFIPNPIKFRRYNSTNVHDNSDNYK